MTVCLHEHLYTVDNTSLNSTNDYSPNQRSGIASFTTEKHSIGSSCLEFKLGKYSIICQVTYVRHQKYPPSEEREKNYHFSSINNLEKERGKTKSKKREREFWFCCQNNRLRKHHWNQNQVRASFRGRKKQSPSSTSRSFSTAMESAVREICGRYSRKIKVPIDENLIRCFSALYEVLQLYHDHEHLVKSTEHLSTTLSSFKSSKSASLRAFASQMTLDIQGSSSEEFLNQQSTSSETLQNGSRGRGGHNRPFSTLSLHRYSSSEVLAGTGDGEEGDDEFGDGADDFYGSMDIIGDSDDFHFGQNEKRIGGDRDNNSSNHKRYLSLGSNLQNISEELVDNEVPLKSSLKKESVSTKCLTFDNNTIMFIDELFKDCVWDKERSDNETDLDLSHLPARQETIRNKYDRSKTIDMGNIERERYVVSNAPTTKKSKTKWILGLGWMFKSNKSSKNVDAEADTPLSIVKDTIKIALRLKKTLKKRKLEEDADILKEMTLKRDGLKKAVKSYGTVGFDLLNLQDNIGRYYSIIVKFSRRRLSKNHRNLLTRLYAFYSRTHFLQTITKIKKFKTVTENFSRLLVEML